MSLVDYASSSGEEDDDKDGDIEAEATVAVTSTATVAVTSTATATATALGAPRTQPLRGIAASPSPLERPVTIESSIQQSMPSHNATSPAMPAVELPDASLLFASSSSFSSPAISGNDHASRVAAAMTANASRKREANGKATHLPQNKHPRANFPSRYVPGRSSSLIPPQLLGRGNVVTEDISKLFVNRRPPF